MVVIRVVARVQSPETGSVQTADSMSLPPSPSASSVGSRSPEVAVVEEVAGMTVTVIVSVTMTIAAEGAMTVTAVMMIVVEGAAIAVTVDEGVIVTDQVRCSINPEGPLGPPMWHLCT
mmetsp:Transcript_88910/g.162825  ORF Transcript_88910/g.162825 Transcript_88910/m.162825 type:complete len:118 (+) Transcript_88910:345-698(+)